MFIPRSRSLQHLRRDQQSHHHWGGCWCNHFCCEPRCHHVGRPQNGEQCVTTVSISLTAHPVQRGENGMSASFSASSSQFLDGAVSAAFNLLGKRSWLFKTLRASPTVNTANRHTANRQVRVAEHSQRLRQVYPVDVESKASLESIVVVSAFSSYLLNIFHIAL